MTDVVRMSRVARPHAARLALATLLAALALGCGVALLATSAWLISRASLQPPVLTLTVAIVAVRAFGIGRGVFRYGERVLGHDAALRVLADLRVDVYRRLERLAPAGLPEFRSGELLSRLVSDVDDVQDVLVRGAVPVAAAALVAAGSVAFVAWLLPAAALVLALGVAVAMLLAPAVVTRVGRRAESRLAPARGRLAVAALDLYEGGAELLAYGEDQAALERLRAADAEVRRIQARSAAASGAGALVGGLALAATVAATSVLAVRAVGSGSLPGEALAVLILLPVALFEALAVVAPSALVVTRARRSAARLAEVADAPEPVADPTSPAPLPGAPYDVEAAGLSVAWPGRAMPAVSGVDLDLPAGARLVLTGPTGSGKTTIAFALVRFLEHDGRLALGATDTSALAADDVRTVVGLCTQDAHLFDSTIEANLRVAAPQADERALRDALRAARLLDFVDGLPDGLQTFVGQHGARLSGGQRQRLGVARAVLAGFDVLVLDEPGEHLDEPTARALLRDVLASAELGGTSLLVISHRGEGLEDLPKLSLA